jgi:hypothetical protein
MIDTDNEIFKSVADPSRKSSSESATVNIFVVNRHPVAMAAKNQVRADNDPGFRVLIICRICMIRESDPEGSEVNITAVGIQCSKN